MKAINWQNFESTLVGYSPQGKDDILSCVSMGRFDDLHGDFILILEGLADSKKVTILITSQVCATPYFFSVSNGLLLHGQDIFDIYKRIPDKEWKWNYSSLYLVNNLEHCIANETLHKDIKRLPHASIVTHQEGENDVTIEKTLEKRNRPISLSEAMERYEGLIDLYFNGNANFSLSLSSGMDSRLLLASLLKKGKLPVLGTMGNSTSTDVKVSREISHKLNLNHQVVTIEKEDYLDVQKVKEIIKATSGSKPMYHWHTFFYIDKVNFPKDHLHVVGSNGEAVRSYYLDKGVVTKGLQFFDFNLFRAFFKLKIDKGNQFVVDSVQSQVNLNEVYDFVAASVSDANKNTADKLDYFYTYQRVRNFIGNGLALYNTRNTTISPFLDVDFQKIASGLSRTNKLNSHFHRKLIDHLYPQLMNFSNTEQGQSISNFETNWYWLKKEQYHSYNIVEKVMMSKEVREALFFSSKLENWVSKKELETMFNKQMYRSISFLYTLMNTLEVISEIDSQKRISA
jgi:hypothetical protein